MSREIIGQSKAVKEMLDVIERIAQSKTNVLIIGESGTGKELVARKIHDSGPLKKGPFVPVNCGAIPENLIESEMFGHKRGSFTGAIGDKEGLFEVADGGTLFLDEVGELPLGMQVKLLRALQERSIRKIGSTESKKVNVRIIAATNRDLEAGIAKGTFREDLYYRLNVILIKAPPLRDRKGDVKILTAHFLNKFSMTAKKIIRDIDQEALAALEAYKWPGNIRELENVIERAVTLENSEVLTRGALPSYVSEALSLVPSVGDLNSKESEEKQIVLPAPDFSKGSLDLDKILGQVEEIYLKSALKQANGVKKKAAELLGITFRSIRYRLKKLGLDSSDEN